MLAEGWTGFDGDAKENLTWGCVGDCEDEMKALGGLDSVMRTRSSNYLWSGQNRLIDTMFLLREDKSMLI